MNRKISLMLLIIFNFGINFSQSTISDPHTGMVMRMDYENKYLEVTSFGFGSPADMSELRVGDKIIQINGRNVNELSNPEEFFINNTDEWLLLSVKRIGNMDALLLKIPCVSIDLNSGMYWTEANLFMSLDIRQKVVKMPSGYDLEKNKNELIEIVNATPDPSLYQVYDVFGGAGCDYRLMADNWEKAIITMLSDDSRNMEKYKTFDFDFLSNDDPLMEKRLAAMLETKLISLGLKRSQETPDLLIILSFYSGQKDQYVPPQQIVSTKIKSAFSWYWGYVPVPVTESKTKEGYTQMTYLSNINLKFLDAKEIETSKTPPIIWSGSISQISFDKIFLTDQANEFFQMTLSQFPLVWQQNAEKFISNNYAFTGILYLQGNFEFVADVIPGSPAAKAGIQKGDKILNICGRNPKFYGNPVLSTWNEAFGYLYVYSKFKNGVKPLFPDASGAFGRFKENGITNLEFDIKRNGKKLTFNIIPEKKGALVFDSLGTTLN